MTVIPGSWAGMIPFFPTRAFQCNWIGWAFTGNTSTVDGSSTLYPLEPNGTTSQETFENPVLTPDGFDRCPYNSTFFIALGDLGALYQAMIDALANEGPWDPGEANRIQIMTGFISSLGTNVAFQMEYRIDKHAGAGFVPLWNVGEHFSIYFNAGGIKTYTSYTTIVTEDFTSAPLGYSSGPVLDAATSFNDFEWFYTIIDDPPGYETNVVFDGIYGAFPLTNLSASVGSSFIPAIGDAFRGMAIFEGDYTSADWPALLALWGTV